MPPTVPPNTPPEEVSLDALRAVVPPRSVPRNVKGTIGVYDGHYIVIPDVLKGTLERCTMELDMYVFDNPEQVLHAVGVLSQNSNALASGGPFAYQFRDRRQTYPPGFIDPSQLIDLAEFHRDEGPSPLPGEESPPTDS